MKILLDVDAKFKIFVDCKELFSSMSAHRNSINNVKSDIGSICYEFGTKMMNEIYWTSGALNLANVLTKNDSPLTNVLIMSL